MESPTTTPGPIVPLTNGSLECVECNVVDDIVSWIAQFCLPAIVGVLLLALWYFEKPRRPFGQFTMDNMKQGFAALFLHFIGVAISEAMHVLEPTANSCKWYFLFFIIDTLVGLFCTIAIHHVTARLFGCFERTRFLSTIGSYNNRDGSSGTKMRRFLRWLGQLLHYVGCSCISRSIVFTVLYIFRDPFVHLVTWLFSWQCTEAQKDIMLVIVLIIVPLTADGLQVTVQNWWLKDRKGLREISSAQPLIGHENNFSDDEDDDELELHDRGPPAIKLSRNISGRTDSGVFPREDTRRNSGGGAETGDSDFARVQADVTHTWSDRRNL